MLLRASTFVALYFISTAATADLDAGLRAIQSKNYEVAFRELSPLAESGEPIALNAIGKLYLQGKLAAKSDEKSPNSQTSHLIEAAAWFRKAANQGHLESLYYLGEATTAAAILTDNDPSEGLRMIRTAAQKGEPNAALHLSNLYTNGVGSLFESALPKFDPEQAELWFYRAQKTATGNADAECGIGQTYRFGKENNRTIIVSKDIKSAMTWMMAAVKHGNYPCATELGRLHKDNRNYEEAIKWFRVGFSGLDQDAAYDLGQMYQYGYGVPIDIPQAKAWYQKAKDGGHHLASSALDRLQ